MSVIAAIALGSNVGERERHIATAIEDIARIGGTQLVATGPVIRTEPVGVPGVDAGGEYLNSCVVVRTELGARELLDALHGIERLHGRDRAREGRWGPRMLDLDLLVYGDRIIEEPGLSVPHPRMAERRFVLEPLAAIAPDLGVPGLGKRVRDLLDALGTRA